MNVTAAATDATGSVPSPRIASTLLAIHLPARGFDGSSILRLMRALSAVGFVHDDRVVQQLFVDARSEIRRLDGIGADFLALSVVYGKFWHCCTASYESQLPIYSLLVC